MAELEALNYSQIALSLLIERFKDSEGIQSLIDVVIEAAMDLQTSVFQINELFTLETAEGPELNIIGTVWDESRKSDTDDDYRDRISIKATISVSGTLPEIKKVLYFLYNATYVDYVIAYPAGYHLLTDAKITQLILNSMTVSGVQGFLGSRLLGTTMPFLLGWSVWKSTL